MAIVLAIGGGASRGYVRACEPECGFEYTSAVGQALRFSSEADALAYLMAEHPIMQADRVVGTFTRRSDLDDRHLTARLREVVVQQLEQARSARKSGSSPTVQSCANPMRK